MHDTTSTTSTDIRSGIPAIEHSFVRLKVVRCITMVCTTGRTLTNRGNAGWGEMLRGGEYWGGNAGGGGDLCHIFKSKIPVYYILKSLPHLALHLRLYLLLWQ